MAPLLDLDILLLASLTSILTVCKLRIVKTGCIHCSITAWADRISSSLSSGAVVEGSPKVRDKRGRGSWMGKSWNYYKTLIWRKTYISSRMLPHVTIGISHMLSNTSVNIAWDMSHGIRNADMNTSISNSRYIYMYTHEKRFPETRPANPADPGGRGSTNPEECPISGRSERDREGAKTY